MSLSWRRLATGLAAALLVGVGVADAGLITTTAGLAAGELALRQPPPVVLTAEGPGAPVVGDLGRAVVVDARGSGAGWRLRIAATGPADGELSVTAVRVESLAGRPPVNRVDYPVRVPFGQAEPVDL